VFKDGGWLDLRQPYPVNFEQIGVRYIPGELVAGAIKTQHELFLRMIKSRCGHDLEF
jgi:hypothetical protein